MKNFYFPNKDVLEFGTPTERFDKNIEAIKLMKSLAGSAATVEQQEILSRYVGWGDSRLTRMMYKIEDGLLTEQENRAVSASSLNAHYTSLSVVSSIWSALLALGIGDRKISALDGAAGIGHFTSMTPEVLRDKIDWTQVELDSITAGILKLLHPENRVHNIGFEEVNLPVGQFDLAISNVPFGNFGVFTKHDVPKMLTKSIHDFYFANTYRLLRPGGIMAYITSRYTMDKKSTKVREWLAERFELVSAVRLPDTAFKTNANTEVVTDVLIMRKRDVLSTEKPAWVESNAFHLGYRYTFVNQHFIDHPEMIMGKPGFEGSMYQGDAYSVELDEENEESLDSRLAKVYGALLPLPNLAPNEGDAPVAVSSDVAQNTIAISSEDKSPVVKAMLGVYKAAKELLREETSELQLKATSLRKKLNKTYDAFVVEYGTLTSNIKRVKGAEAGFLRSLERTFGGKTTRSDIFARSITRAKKKMDLITPGDALLLSMDSYGCVNLEYIAARLSCTQEEAAENLIGSIFLDPESNEWKTAEAYLSGNVRKKHREAVAASEYDERYKVNAQALEAVVPVLLLPGQIRAPLGASWVPSTYISEFVTHLLGGGETKIDYINVMATWTIKVDNYYGVSRSNLNSKWGTQYMNAIDIVEAGLNSKTPVVYSGTKEEREVDQVATTAAQQKLVEVKDEFDKWLWADEERALILADIYNESFNSVRNITFSGAHLSTPGLATSISLRSEQKNAAWRVIQNDTVLIGHEVGMGKTLTAIVAAMESKRLGFTKKAMIVVPNHTISNWQAALLESYPGANLLMPEPSDLSKTNRPHFLSLMATNNWDIILVPFSSFKLLPVSRKRTLQFFAGQLEELRDCLEEAREDGQKHSAKEIEKALKRLEIKVKTLQEFKKDSEETITWEELGIDMLVVDEFHAFKNLYFTTKMTRIAGMSNSDSQRAFDMLIKSSFILERGGKFVGMTGTPITNTIAEMFTMQRYFQLATLKRVGLSQFDAWVRQFALSEPGLEMTPDGGGFRMNTRFRRFVNVPELMQLFMQIADIKSVDPAEIQRPNLYGNKPLKVVSSGGQDLENFVKTLAARAEKIRAGLVNPEDDNMLCITSDGRKSALDMSLVVPATLDAPMPKIDKLAKVVSEIARATEAVLGTQLIFCDLGTPKARKLFAELEADIEDPFSDGEDTDTDAERVLTTNMYEQIKMRLILAGIKPQDIAFIHSAKTHAQRATMFKAVNDGLIRVLVGSNEKMGTGINVQERLVATHHITPPWRPGDIAQQVGRMHRQGNKFPNVYQFVHITEKSFDGYIWQLLETKAGFISQIMSGVATDREMDDIGDTVLTFSEIKGLASGNPKIMQKIVMDTEWKRLTSIQTAWKSSLFFIKSDASLLVTGVESQRSHLKALQEAIVTRDNATHEEWRLFLKDVWGDGSLLMCKDKDEAHRKLIILAHQAKLKINTTLTEAVIIGQYRGHNIVCGASVDLDGNVSPILYLNIDGHKSFMNITEGSSLVNSLDSIMQRFESKCAKVEKDIETDLGKIAKIQDEIGKPWDHLDKLTKLEADLNVLNKELQGVAGAEGSLAIEVPVNNQTDEAVAKAIAERKAAYASLTAMMADPAAIAGFGNTITPARVIAPVIIGPAYVEVKPAQKKTIEPDTIFVQTTVFTDVAATQMALF